MRCGRAIAAASLPKLELRFDFGPNFRPARPTFGVLPMLDYGSIDLRAVPLGARGFLVPIKDTVPKGLHVVDLLRDRELVEPRRRYGDGFTHAPKCTRSPLGCNWS